MTHTWNLRSRHHRVRQKLLNLAAFFFFVILLASILSGKEVLLGKSEGNKYLGG
jgi:hypothetical protein